jgi:hypothetical protein
MRYEAIKKRAGQWVRIRPALQVYDDSAILRDTVEDAWQVEDITESTLTLQTRDHQYRRTLGLDHVHNYMADPEGERTLGTTGMLVLNVQLLVFESMLLTEPVAPPGSPLKVFVPARPRTSLLNAAARMRAAEQLEKARKEFAWSEAGVRAANAAFNELPAAIENLRKELAAGDQPVPVELRRIYEGGQLLKAAGWWVTLYWRRQYANTLDDAWLCIEQLDGPPKLPNLMVFEEPRRVRSDRYSFGLAAIGEPRWMAKDDPTRSYTTVGLAQEILTRLFETPNTRR